MKGGKDFFLLVLKAFCAFLLSRAITLLTINGRLTLHECNHFHRKRKETKADKLMPTSIIDIETNIKYEIEMKIADFSWKNNVE